MTVTSSGAHLEGWDGAVQSGAGSLVDTHRVTEGLTGATTSRTSHTHIQHILLYSPDVCTMHHMYLAGLYSSNGHDLIQGREEEEDTSRTPNTHTTCILLQSPDWAHYTPSLTGLWASYGCDLAQGIEDGHQGKD